MADDGTPLFPDLTPMHRDVEPAVKAPTHPVWTRNKALLIERYLNLFVQITRHGTYIDGFAGPQKRGRLDAWSAKLVLEHERKFLRHFHLIDLDERQVQFLHELRAQQPDIPGREVFVHHGDCNLKIPEVLASGAITEREATFCLLDQRTFECDWATVAALATHKKDSRYKIEQFYFLANGWFERAVAALREEGEARVSAWWGRDDWRTLATMRPWDRAAAFVARFREFGYLSVKAWPIYGTFHGSRIMYFMIHATDHDEAPKLMTRAYEAATPPGPQQLALL